MIKERGEEKSGDSLVLRPDKLPGKIDEEEREKGSDKESHRGTYDLKTK